MSLRVLSSIIIALFIGFAAIGQGGIQGESLDTLNVRTSPSGDVITSIAYATPLMIDGRNAIGNWLLVHTVDNRVRGWVASRFINWDAEQYPLSDLPVVSEQVPAESAIPVMNTQNFDSQTGGTPHVTVNLNVRSGPCVENDVIKVLTAGTPVTIIDNLDDWLQIQTVDGAVSGWVAARFVSSDFVGRIAPSSDQSGGQPPASIADDDSSLIVINMKRTGPQVAPIVEGINTRHVNLTHYPDIEITLHWNTTLNLDLHVVDPLGYEIYPGSGPSPSGGYLHNPDNNDCSIANRAPIEVITWDNKSNPPRGTYVITAQYMNTCNPQEEHDTLFWVSVKNNGIEEEFWVFLIQPGESYRFSFTR